MKNYFLLLLSTLVIFNLNVSLALPGPINTHSNGTEIIKDVPIDACFYNPCCDEDVCVTGIAHFVINDNIIHLNVANISGTGQTTSTAYTGRGPSVETNVFYSNQNEGHFTFKLNLSNDEGCSFRLKATFQINVNANGDVTVSFENVDVHCQP